MRAACIGSYARPPATQALPPSEERSTHMGKQDKLNTHGKHKLNACGAEGRIEGRGEEERVKKGTRFLHSRIYSPSSSLVDENEPGKVAECGGNNGLYRTRGYCKQHKWNFLHHFTVPAALTLRPKMSAHKGWKGCARVRPKSLRTRRSECLVPQDGVAG
ncbi:hypothetical protein E2C01_078612 [Portunus trituberculatus]|uniref:Uncharacterized protein n=1 Tax=Portunus trituberculatus TaxID=210409 RepID=A0A5B7IES4_PORTR|nr:hypothetical protein [Portunus trituberculatus]